MPTESPIFPKNPPWFSTHDLFVSPPAGHYKYIFVFADPLDSAMSVDKMVEENGESWFRSHQDHLRAVGEYRDLYTRDVLNYEGQLESWLGLRRDDVFCVEYEDLWERTDGLSSFLGFELVLPPRRPRQATPAVERGDLSLFERLRELKESMKSAYERRYPT
jgi:hypothetical protein